MLRFLMESNGSNQNQMAEAMGMPASTVTEILKGRRRLTRTHIGRLTQRFSVPATVFFDTENG